VGAYPGACRSRVFRRWPALHCGPARGIQRPPGSRRFLAGDRL